MWVLTDAMLRKMGTQSAQQAWEPCIVCINVDMNWTRMIQTAAVLCVIERWVYDIVYVVRVSVVDFVILLFFY